MGFGVAGTILGVAVGFTTIMLLLSLVVTGLAQGLQSALRLRARATRRVLAEYLVAEKELDEGAAAELARRLVATTKRRPQPLDRATVLALDTLGPPVRVIAPELLESEAELSEPQRKRLGALISDRFQTWMHWVSIVFGFAIAFGFQVSTGQLLKDLSLDPELRARAASMAERTEKLAESATAFDERVESVVARLVAERPELAGTLEQLSGQVQDWPDARAELELLLDHKPERDRVATLQRFDELAREADSRETEVARSAREELALVNIEFWDQGWQFYHEGGWKFRWNNVFGVFMTGILLSFGAPFWYEWLRRFRVLNDALKPKEEEAKGEGKKKARTAESPDTGAAEVDADAAEPAEGASPTEPESTKAGGDE